MPKIGMAGASMMMVPMLAALRAAIKHGFEAFEVLAEFPQCVVDELTPAQREEARALVADSGIAIAAHSPFNSLNIAALNPGIRAESVRQSLDAVDLCADLGGSAVVIHNGAYVTSKRLRGRVPQAGTMQWDHNVDSLKRIAERAQERGVTLCLENIGFERIHMDERVDDLLTIREQVQKAGPSLSFCLDVGHARLNHDLPRAFEVMGPHVRHVHLTDNFGERDDHVEIGTGNFDYGPYLDFLNSFPHIVTLEVVKFGADPKPAITSRENFVKILKGQ